MRLRDQLQQVAADAAAEKVAAAKLLGDKDKDLQEISDRVAAQTKQLNDTRGKLRNAGAAANTLANQITDQAEQLSKKNGCLRTAEAFIAALAGRVQEFAEQEPAFYNAEIAANHKEIASLRQQLAAEQQNNADVQQIVSNLQTNLVPLQNSWYFTHFMHKLQVRKQTSVARCLVLSTHHQHR